eukprot:15668543-Heterocapsa_arctica.AAC.1
MAGILQVSGNVVSVPTGAAADPALTFARLCEAFKIDPKVGTFLVETEGLETLEDFKAFITDKAQVETKVISKVTDLTKPGLNAARLRLAWEATSEAASEGALRKQRGESNDLDTLLHERELLSLQQAFWGRHKLNFGAEVEPSDFLISRISKEIQRRQCQMHSVFRTRTLTHMLKAERKRQPLAGGMELLLAERESDPVIPFNIRTYLSMLFTLLLAYARAGCTPLEDAPKEHEASDQDTTTYVEVPLDVVLRYHGRVTARANALPDHMALQWVRARDEAERMIWMEEHRSTKLPLGRIVRDTFRRREAMWDLPVAAPHTQHQDTGGLSHNYDNKR